MKYTANLAVLAAMLIAYNAAAAILPDNTDGDLLPDATERWLIGQGITLDDGGQPIDAGGAANNYQDADADGIPNLVETHITHTRNNQPDNVLKNCPGDGVDNLTGQYGIRIAPNASLNGKLAGHNILLQKVSGVSVCHKGANSFDIYHPELGYANTVNFNSGTRALTATWSTNSTTMNAIYFDNATPDRTDDRLDGNLDSGATWVQNGNVNDMRSSFHDLLDTAFVDDIEAIYGMQLKLLDDVSDYGPVDSPLNPASTAFQLDILANSVSAAIYQTDGGVNPAWYVPSVGALHVRVRMVVTDIDEDGDTLNDDKISEDIEFESLFTRDTIAAADGRLRGILDIDKMIDLDYQTLPGDDSVESKAIDFYAIAQPPAFAYFTESNETGQQRTRIAVRNVPLSATKITLTGSGNAAGFGSIDLVDNSVNGKTMADVNAVRNRIPGITNDPALGVSGGGVNQYITQVTYGSTPGLLASDGDYTISFTGDALATTSVSGTYVKVPAVEILPAAQNLQWDGNAIASITPMTDVRPDIDHTLSWDRITSGGTNSDGAGLYQWIAVPGDADTELNFFGATHLFAFKNDNTSQCLVTDTRCNLVIEAGTLKPDSSYCFQILSRSNGNGSNRSRTDAYCLTTSSGGNLADDIVIDFGGIGLWSWMNDGTWLKLNNSSPDDVITGDVDGNGIDDVIADFGSTFGGIFIKRNGGAWAKLHNSSPQSMATGDLDGNGSDDIVIDFGGIGLWARMNDSSWLKLNNSSPDQVVVTDMDGNGADDVIADFGSTFGGIFVKLNGGAWAKLHNNSPVTMGTGDLDGNGSGDVIINFGGIGLWARMNNASWLKLHNGSPDSIVSGDVDGNGADDVVASFGSSFGGVWQKLNLGGWSKLNNNAPDQMVMGDIDANGQSDLIGAFNSTLGGIFVRRNNGAWAKLHNNNPDDLAVGELDGI